MIRKHPTVFAVILLVGGLFELYTWWGEPGGFAKAALGAGWFGIFASVLLFVNRKELSSDF